jgi:hypothetical protein
MPVRGERGGLPQLGAAKIALEQLPHRDRRRSMSDAGARRAVSGHQLPASRPGRRGVTAHGERALDTTAAARVEATTTRTSQTPGLRSRSDPVPRFDRVAADTDPHSWLASLSLQRELQG